LDLQHHTEHRTLMKQMMMPATIHTKPVKCAMEGDTALTPTTDNIKYPASVGGSKNAMCMKERGRVGMRHATWQVSTSPSSTQSLEPAPLAIELRAKERADR